MKNLRTYISILFVMSWGSITAFASVTPVPVIYISAKSAVHLRSPEPISYVDLPSSKISGDLPLKNLLRLRLSNADSLGGRAHELGVVTVTGEHFLAQFLLVQLSPDSPQLDSEIEILPVHMLPLLPSARSLSMPQIQAKALEVISKKPGRALAATSNQGISVKVHQILSCGDLIFLDLGFANATALDYQLEQISFTIADKKINKATNFQQFPLELKASLYPMKRFSKQARNIFVLTRATFSADKRLIIQCSEKQPSSRVVNLTLNYGDILGADSF
ncbi:DUF4138 domain-containing protein [bacterium]|nr:MAG: DUF4138 domain-containing protein [bacterium]